MSDYFTWIKTRNCRRFHKRTYTLDEKIDYQLIDSLKEYGELEVIPFSNYSSNAKDVFKIRWDNTIEIGGAVGDNYLQITISKEISSIIQVIESLINSWHENKVCREKVTSEFEFTYKS